MLIKILAFAVLLVLLLNSASFIQVDTLKTRTQKVSLAALLDLSQEALSDAPPAPNHEIKTHTILPCAYICIK